jgi:hypothetical protein
LPFALPVVDFVFAFDVAVIVVVAFLALSLPLQL